MAKKPRQRDGYYLFWSEWPSNWHPSAFVIDGRTYSCVEQWMMYQKAAFFGDKSAAAKIMATSDPRDQKRYGRQVRNYVDAKWASVRYQIVLQGVVAKYRQNADLKELLLASGDLQFVEASPDDKIWGIGLSADDPDATRPGRWRGQNLLGKATTEARSIIRADP